jgi:hypothetical protein
MNLDEIQKLAVKISDKYDTLNKQQRGVTWNEQQLWQDLLVMLGIIQNNNGQTRFEGDG